MKVREQVPSSVYPIVSISCISYNQEDYIGNCIEGFLNQEVDFPVEILIHDDASTDDTPQIIQGYVEKYPHIIKPILQTENQFRKGIRCMHATFNFFRSKGEFIATCEGDDYWIDDKKLYKQVKFLQQNRDFAMSSHDTYVGYWNEKRTLRTALAIIYRNVNIDGFRGGRALYKRLIKDRKDFWLSRRMHVSGRQHTLELKDVFEMYQKAIFIPTVSITGRGELLRNMPKEIYDSPTGHKEHIFWLVMNGKVFFSNEVMGQKINQKNSLTQTNIHKKENRTTDKKDELNNYLARFLALSIPASSKNMLNTLI